MTYEEDDFVNDFFRIANEHGYKMEICGSGKAKGLRQVNFGNKKLQEEQVRCLFRNGIMNHNSDIPSLMERCARGRPCNDIPVKAIIAQLRADKCLPIGTKCQIVINVYK